MDEMESREAVRWIRHCSISDPNWSDAMKRLTDEELAYCLDRETRKSAISKLLSEHRRRVRNRRKVVS